MDFWVGFASVLSSLVLCASLRSGSVLFGSSLLSLSPRPAGWLVREE